jgi:phage tail-like protein
VGKSTLVDWFVQTMSEQFVRKPVTIKLLDADFKTIMTWNLDGALPIKWTGPQLKADSSAVAIQTLDLACNDVTVQAN